MGYLISLGVMALMIHLVLMQQVTEKEVTEKEGSEEYTSIDNNDLYAEHRKLKQGQYLYPLSLSLLKIYGSAFPHIKL